MDNDDILPSQRVNETELLEMERDRQAHAQPNEPDADPFDACSGNAHRMHSFSVLDPKGHRCKYCNRRWRECLKTQ